MSCNQESDAIINIFDQVDTRSPILINIEALSTQTITITFNEALDRDSIAIRCQNNTIQSLMVHNERVTIVLGNPIALSQAQAIEGSVRDLRGNSTYFTVEAWAKNEQVPTLLINEFTTKGTESNPDRVELIATSRGNVAGVTLYAGTNESWTDRIVLPDLWVERGTYLVVSFSKEALEDTMLFSELGAGLGSNNGCLSLAKTPHWNSTLLDAVVWGNHTTTTHEGFGSQALKDAVQALYAQGHWKSNSCNESVDSTNSTATRSFCRDNFRDTNSRSDWYICATREASFGFNNSSIRHL